MRLLHVQSLHLEDFSGSEIPPYAILSHTWDEEEVTFQEASTATWVQKVGLEKINSCASEASQHGLEYFWIDTCCELEFMSLLTIALADHAPRHRQILECGAHRGNKFYVPLV
jgi:hypothetical protein